MMNKSCTVFVLSSLDRPVFKGLICEDCILDDVRVDYDKHGNAIYDKVGEINIKEFVNSFKDVCSLSSLLNRINLMPVNEKINYLHQTDGITGDFTFVPKDLTEAYLMLQNVESKYPGALQKISSGVPIKDVVKSFSPKVKSANVVNNENKEGSDNGEA